MKSLFAFFYNLFALLSVAKQTTRQIQLESELRPRQIQNLTDTYSGIIKRDFPEFDPQEFLSRAENILLSIFTSLESLHIREVDKTYNPYKDEMYDPQNKNVFRQNESELSNPFSPNMTNQIKEVIEDIKSKNEKWYFDDITIHKSGISKYTHNSGSKEIAIEIAVSYVFHALPKGSEASTTDSKSTLGQYKYILKAVYIQNPHLMGSGSMQGHNCPNCGAPVLSLGIDKFCAYCGTGLKEINTRIWVFDHYSRV